MTLDELCKSARDMLKLAYVPYSGFPVGAALECDDGTAYTGCNIENAAYGPTNCAERTAVFKAVSEGHKSFKRIVVTSRADRFCYPCGVCRQVLSEFSPDMDVIMLKPDGETKTVNLRDLLPYTFDGSVLS